MSAAIQFNEPVVIPAQPEKVFPDAWISQLLVTAPTTQVGNIRFDLLPYNAATREIAPGPQETLSISLWEAAQNIPECAVALGAVFAAVPAIRAYLAAHAVVALPQPEPQPEQPQDEPAPDQA